MKGDIMGYDDRRKRKEELDSFWEIERMAPAKKVYPNHQKRNTDTVEISVSSVLESLTDSRSYTPQNAEIWESAYLKYLEFFAKYIN